MYAEATNEASNGPTDRRLRSPEQGSDPGWPDGADGVDVPAIQGSRLARTPTGTDLRKHAAASIWSAQGRLLDAVKAENSFARNATIQPFHVLMPIPQADMDANPNLKQNPGY
jgi:hypothetical protein